jgi:hypothetical protein
MDPNTQPAENPPAPEPQPVVTPLEIPAQAPVTEPQPTVTGPALTPEIYTIGGVTQAQPPAGSPGPAPKRRFKPKKPALLAGLAALVVLGGSAAAYFGYYVPNKPDNLWKTALVRTGKGYDKLSDYTVTQFQSKNSGLKLSGNFKTSGAIAADGSFSGSTDKDNGEFTGSVSAAGLNVKADVRLLKSSTSTPDFYIKVDGLQGLDDLIGGFAPGYKTAINGLNGNWYFIDHSLFDQFGGSSGNNLQFNADDLKSVLKAVGDASKQNIFTSDPNKMAFTIQKESGSEKQDGRSVYHYTAGINKDNLKDYVNTLCANLKNSSLKKILGNDSQNVSDTIGCTTASEAVKNFDSSRTADVWVDKHTKLIHKIRITEPKNKKDYFDISQDYQGGTKFPFGIGFSSSDSGDTSSGGLNFSLDTKTNKFSMSGSAKSSGSGNFSGNFSLDAQPNSQPVKVEKPANAKNIIQLLNDLGISQTYGDIQSTAKDTERKTDINALQGQVEAFWAENGNYPSLSQINDASWRATNMKGLDPEAFKDPEGSSTTLAAATAAHVYSYVTTPAGCDNVKVQCTGFTLTATLGTGGTYAKNSLN